MFRMAVGLRFWLRVVWATSSVAEATHVRVMGRRFDW